MAAENVRRTADHPPETAANTSSNDTRAAQRVLQSAVASGNLRHGTLKALIREYKELEAPTLQAEKKSDDSDGDE